MTENNLEKKMNFGLKEDTNIKFKEYFPVDKSIPEGYYALYGDCAPQMFKKEKIKDNIKKAYNKNKFKGFVVRKYYEIFRRYRSDESISKDVFKSLKWIFEDYPELIKKV